MSNVAQVKDGQFVDSGNLLTSSAGETASSTSKNKGSTLDKESFLQLLVAQMQNQDPLNPSTDTEYVAQLAQFSSLEQLQNLNSSFSDTQAFSLIGKTVLVQDDAETEGMIEGIVEYVTKSGSKTYISVNGTKYSIEDLISVESDSYVAQKKAPSIKKQDLEFDFENEKDLEIFLNLGIDDGKADGFGVILNGQQVDTKYLSFDEKKNELTINKEALHGLNAGKYSIGFVFNDPLTTTVVDQVTLTVTGTNPYSEEGTDDTDQSTDDTDQSE
ncbi:MAG: flagellar hook capping FlgD N-terminal domain-containing protein [Clostridiales bacterium]|nr:flagellar hook capping FlgD N-terminal domain-containing protein [Clostridiales bacterium]